MTQLDVIMQRAQESLELVYREFDSCELDADKLTQIYHTSTNVWELGEWVENKAEEKLKKIGEKDAQEVCRKLISLGGRNWAHLEQDNYFLRAIGPYLVDVPKGKNGIAYTIYFDSEEEAEKAIEAIGEEKVARVLWFMEDVDGTE